MRQQKPSVVGKTRQRWPTLLSLHTHASPFIAFRQYAELPRILAQGVTTKVSEDQKTHVAPVSFDCRTVGDLQNALHAAVEKHANQFVLINVRVDSNDFNVELPGE